MKLNYDSFNSKIYRWFYNVEDTYDMPSNKCNLIFRCIIMYIFILPIFIFCIPGIIGRLIDKDNDNPSLKVDCITSIVVYGCLFGLWLMYLPIRDLFIEPIRSHTGFDVALAFGLTLWIVLFIIIIALIYENWNSFRLPKFLTKNCDEIEWYERKKRRK